MSIQKGSQKVSEKEMSKKIKPVRVDWVDSMGHSGWRDYEPAEMSCVSVGMLYKENKDSIVIALNKSAYNHGDYMEIPKVAIKSITKLKKSPRRG